MIRANVKEINRPGRKCLQVVSRKGKPIEEFPCHKGMREEVVQYFKDNDLKPMKESPEWLKRGWGDGQAH